MPAPTCTRRDLARGLLVLLAGPPLVACERPLECTDTTGLDPADVELRVRTLRYTDTSPDPARTCSGCQQFRSRGANACGGCVIVRGAIHPRGRCAKWAARPA